jgi:hypothetical protein
MRHMAKRACPILVATRVTPMERGLIDTAAAAEGVTVAALVRQILLPAVRERVAASVNAGESQPS